MNLRHRLIRWLSFGDMILLNAEISDAGVIRSRNAGPMLVAGIEVRFWSKPCAVAVSCDVSHDLFHAALQLSPTGRQGLTLAQTRVDYVKLPDWALQAKMQQRAIAAGASER